ncbi:protein adenylyltransferase SelO [Algiphilus sp.]|uniref:protein adenylyltransferase SelO n=1 Tax=Algiphilus sp. TaxID=1872431 RepID=UPI003C62E422
MPATPISEPDAATTGWPRRLASPAIAAFRDAEGAPAFGAQVPIKPLDAPRLLHLNTELAADLGIEDDPETREALAATAGGGDAAACTDGFASVYAGHQFGVFVPQLGDGRATIIGTLRDHQGEDQEIQLKGAGPTPYSRFADGRAVLRSTVREYLASEALHALGIPTTRALAIVGSDTPVQRETVERAAVLYRVAPSHLRFGHFEYLAATGRTDDLRALATHAMARFRPDLAPTPEGFRAWLSDIVARTARLVAQWQGVGFCHGVMNTDNFSILGLTIDYGPYGFMERFHRAHICNHSDHEGRYAYARQPAIAQWNCARMISACLSLVADDGADNDERIALAQPVLDAFASAYSASALAIWRDKLGLREARDGDDALVNDLLERMEAGDADFTRTFRALADLRIDGGNPLAAHLGDDEAVTEWLSRYRERLRAEHSDDDARRERMHRTNPRYVLRNWLAQHAISAAESGDLAPLDRLLGCLRRPFDEQPECADLDAPPPDWAAGLSVSCSS